MCPSAQLSGIHPRSEELIELTREFDRGRADEARMGKLIEAETLQVIGLQQRLGFEYLTDGALYWQDPLRPLTKTVRGVSSGARYSRWFDTNTFYLKPVITGPVSLGEFQSSDFVRSDLQRGNAKWKVALPGPYTFSELSENKHGTSKDQLILSIANAEKELIQALARSHVSLVQLSEPCLVYRPYREDNASSGEIQTALDAIRIVAEDSPIKVAVQTYFGDAAPILSRLSNLPLESVGFDLYATDYEKLRVKSPRPIVLGIVDSRESHVEDPKWIAHTATLVSKHIEAPDVVFSPNSDLKYLPRTVADAKVEALSSAARIYRETD
jgi:5-methyltetrahydropteroyltriglutamate--homocysteine methyltransferase